MARPVSDTSLSFPSQGGVDTAPRPNRHSHLPPQDLLRMANPEAQCARRLPLFLSCTRAAQQRKPCCASLLSPLAHITAQQRKPRCASLLSPLAHITGPVPWSRRLRENVALANRGIRTGGAAGSVAHHRLPRQNSHGQARPQDRRMGHWRCVHPEGAQPAALRTPTRACASHTLSLSLYLASLPARARSSPLAVSARPCVAYTPRACVLTTRPRAQARLPFAPSGVGTSRGKQPP